MNDQNNAVFTVHEAVDGLPVMWRTVFSSLTDAKQTIDATRVKRSDEDEVVLPLKWNEEDENELLAYDSFNEEEPRWMINRVTLAIAKPTTRKIRAEVTLSKSVFFDVPLEVADDDVKDWILKNVSDEKFDSLVWRAEEDWVSTTFLDDETDTELDVID